MLQTDLKAATNNEQDIIGSGVYLYNSKEKRHFVKFSFANCKSNTFRTEYCELDILVKEYQSFKEATASNFGEKGQVIYDSSFRYKFIDQKLVSIFEIY